MLHWCRNCFSPGPLWTHRYFWSWWWNRSKHVVRHQTCWVAMGTGHSWDPSNSCTEQPAQESSASGWWTDQDWPWCGRWCTVGCWWVWILHCSSHCLGMYHDEEMSFEYLPCWNRHPGNWANFFSYPKCRDLSLTRRSIIFFTIIAEILAGSLANFYCQYADRPTNL